MLRPVMGLVALSASLLNGQLVHGQSTPSLSNADVQEIASKLVRMHNAWSSKMSTPNTRLTIRESARSEQVIKFRLYADGLPKDGIYTIVTWPVTQKQPSELLTGVTLDTSGLAICAGRPGTCGAADKPNDPIDLNILQPVAGEPVRLGLVSADGVTKVLASSVPIPLHGEDRGCAVDAVLLLPRGMLVLVEGSGFPASSELKMDSDSEGERHGGNGKVDRYGHYVSAVVPYKLGTPRGTLRVTLKSANCAPSVSVPWGPPK